MEPQYSTTQQSQYPTWVALIYIFNLIVGTGALTLPAAYVEAGWLLSTIMLIILGLVGFITVTFMIETMACANATIHMRRLANNQPSVVAQLSESSDDDDGDTGPQAFKHYYSLEKRVELVDMAKFYFDTLGLVMFYTSLCLYLFGDLAIYMSAIPITLTDLTCTSAGPGNQTENYDVPCWERSSWSRFDIYRVHLLLFTVLICPFAYFDIHKTKALQIFTTVLRWTAFVIMIGLAVNRLVKNPPIHREAVNIYGFPALIGSSVYSYMCHHSIPGIIHPLNYKRHIIRQIGQDYLLIAVFYLILAITGAFAFKHMEVLYTLNFLPQKSEPTTLLFKIVQYFLASFPIFTLSTSFPIIAITLQNNLKSSFMDMHVHVRDGNFCIRRMLFPTFALAPPLLLVIWTNNLKALIALTGSFAGVMIQYVIPALLVRGARKKLKLELGNSKNRYASPFKHFVWIWAILVWAALCMVLVTMNYLKKYKVI